MGTKSSNAASSYDYYATWAVVVRAGPIDSIRALIVDGKSVWEGPISRTDPGVGNPYPLTIGDPTRLRDGGYVRLYWGDDDQVTPDPALVGHPPYRGIAYIVLHRFLLGRERNTLPNVEVIATAAARPHPSIISATDLQDGCVNPWAVAAEILTSKVGLRLSTDQFNAASWQSAHDSVADRDSLCYVAPILTSQVEARRFLADILTVCDGTIRRDASGRLEAVQLDIDPGDLDEYTLIDANSLTNPPRYTASAWDSVPTGVQVRFVDRDRSWKESAVSVHDMRAMRTVGEPRIEQLDRSHITRRDQAHAQAAEWNKRYCQPRLRGTISVRRQRAVTPDGSPLRHGDRFRLDVDPEPGGDGWAQLCRVLSRRTGPTGDVEIAWEAEPNQPLVVVTPAYTPPSQPDLTVPAIVHARVFSLPVGQTDDDPAVMVLASRPGDLVIGAYVEFDVESSAGVFTRLGTQVGFAVRGRLGSAFALGSQSQVIDFEVLDTRDESILSGWVGGISAATNDELLLVVYSENGRFIASDSDTLPVLEVFSVQSQSATAAGRYDLTCLRARMGTRARDWASNATAWIVRRSSLVAHRHREFPVYQSTPGNELVFRLRPFSPYAVYDGVPSDLPFYFSAAYLAYPQIEWITPSTVEYTLPTSGNLTPDATITDADGNLVRLEVFARRLDTQDVATHLDIPFPETSRQTLSELFTLAGVSATINFAGRSTEDTRYDLVIRATDRSGAIVESARLVTRPATSGPSTSLPTCTFYPDYGAPYRGVAFDGLGTLYITGTSPATELHIATEQSPVRLDPPGSAGTTYTECNSRAADGSLKYFVNGSVASYPLWITHTCWVWARASNGTTHSDWVRIYCERRR